MPSLWPFPAQISGKWVATSALVVVVPVTGSRTAPTQDVDVARAVGEGKVRGHSHRFCSQRWEKPGAFSVHCITCITPIFLHWPHISKIDPLYRPPPFIFSPDLFCYRCGEPGHVARDCERTEDGEEASYSFSLCLEVTHVITFTQNKQWQPGVSVIDWDGFSLELFPGFPSRKYHECKACNHLSL